MAAPELALLDGLTQPGEQAVTCAWIDRPGTPWPAVVQRPAVASASLSAVASGQVGA